MCLIIPLVDIVRWAGFRAYAHHVLCGRFKAETLVIGSRIEDSMASTPVGKSKVFAILMAPIMPWYYGTYEVTICAGLADNEPPCCRRERMIMRPYWGNQCGGGVMKGNCGSGR